MRKSRTGRIIVKSIFWSAAAFAAIALLGSIFMSLYGQPPTGDASTQRQHAWCLNTLTGLRDELLTEASFELTNPKAHESRWTSWHANWKDQLGDATARCAQGSGSLMTQGFERLAELDVAYSAAVADTLRGRSEINAALDGVVAELKKQRP